MQSSTINHQPSTTLFRINNSKGKWSSADGLKPFADDSVFGEGRVGIGIESGDDALGLQAFGGEGFGEIAHRDRLSEDPGLMIATDKTDPPGLGHRPDREAQTDLGLGRQRTSEEDSETHHGRGGSSAVNEIKVGEVRIPMWRSARACQSDA